MIGKINYGTGSLTTYETSADLPIEGSSAVLYYVQDINTFFTWDAEMGVWRRLRTRENMYLLDGEYLNEVGQGTFTIDTDKMTAIDPATTELPDVGDIVFDKLGACGNIISKSGSFVTIRTQQAPVPKRIKYADGSWEMWDTSEQTSGHYYWDATSGLLNYEGFIRDRNSAVVYEKYTVEGGTNDYVIPSGAKPGTRLLVAWDGGAYGEGTLRYYYTTEREDNGFTSNNEIVTVGNMLSTIQALTGIYVGYAQTENELNHLLISGYPTGHELSENDWAYVMHYADNVKQYSDETSFSIGDVIERDSLLYKAEQDFVKSTWSQDVRKCFQLNGTRCSFIYRMGNNGYEWVKGMEIEQDFPFPDGVKLITNSHNQMTINTDGVTTINIANGAVTNPKIADGTITNDKISNDTIEKNKLSTSLQETVTKAETCWYSKNFIVSRNQPAAPEEGYIIWVDVDSTSL